MQNQMEDILSWLKSLLWSEPLSLLWLKKFDSSPFDAEILLFGFRSSICVTKSIPESGIRSNILFRGIFGHFGNSGLKSLSSSTPGHV